MDLETFDQEYDLGKRALAQLRVDWEVPEYRELLISLHEFRQRKYPYDVSACMPVLRHLIASGPGGMDLLISGTCAWDDGCVVSWISHWDISLLPLAVRVGADVNLRREGVRRYEEIETTMLDDAVAQGRVDVATELLALGADPNLPNVVIGRLPLCVAVNRQDRAMVELLLANGADPNLSLSILGDALRGRDFNLVYLLLNHGADPNLQDARSISWVSAETLGKFLDVSSYSLNAPREEGRHLLAWYADYYARHPGPHAGKWVQVLLDHGADIDFAGPHKELILQDFKSSVASM